MQNLTTVELTTAEKLKFILLAEGLSLSPQALAYIEERNPTKSLTPADYASTSGVILNLADDVWVNAPFVDYNPNFVTNPTCTLTVQDDQLLVTGYGLSSPARFWLPPTMHAENNLDGVPYSEFGFTHTDRVRISPIEGCSMACQFCNLPYEFKYRTKRAEDLVATVQRALDDPVQPASHVLISGGTPKEADYDYLNEVYEAVLNEFSDIGVDIMMVPIPALIDVERLKKLGVDGLSMNIEIYNRDLAKRIINRKYRRGLEEYLDFLELATETLGPGRCRSMLMVGLESMEDTLAGVRAIAERGCVPVLSPFRPDQATPMRNQDPPDFDLLTTAYLAAREITEELDVPLGPRCIPCSHNTLSLARSGHGDADHHYGHPRMI